MFEASMKIRRGGGGYVYLLSYEDRRHVTTLTLSAAYTVPSHTVHFSFLMPAHHEEAMRRRESDDSDEDENVAVVIGFR